MRRKAWGVESWALSQGEEGEKRLQMLLLQKVPPPSDVVVEAEIPVPARDPGQPSRADRAAHRLTHCPYRRWCEDCVRGQAYGWPHRSVPE